MTHVTRPTPLGRWLPRLRRAVAFSCCLAAWPLAAGIAGAVVDADEAPEVVTVQSATEELVRAVARERKPQFIAPVTPAKAGVQGREKHPWASSRRPGCPPARV